MGDVVGLGGDDGNGGDDDVIGGVYILCATPVGREKLYVFAAFFVDVYVLDFCVWLFLLCW